MGSNVQTICWYVITFWVMILSLSCYSSFSQDINNVSYISPKALDDYLYNYSSNSTSKRSRTGVIYNISLPANFSSMQVSILRLRSSTLWAKGTKFSSFDIPPRMTTMPRVKRLAIMYENFGNLSSQYYELPGYTFITSIVGVTMYDASERTSSKRLNVTTTDEEQISVKFSKVRLPTVNNSLVKCIAFDPTNGNVELSDMTKPNVCLSRTVGHFALGIPTASDGPTMVPLTPPPPSPVLHQGRDRNRVELWMWWVIGFAAGLMVLIAVFFVSVLCYRVIVSRKITRMERMTEKSESLDTIWIRTSKMPSARSTRTQASLENDLSP